MKATRIIAILLAVVLLVLSGGMSWAVAQDYNARDIVMNGATATGLSGQTAIALGGFTSSEAKAAIEERLVKPLMRPLTVYTGVTGTYTVDPSEYITVDTDTMVHAAMAPGLAASVPERVARRLAKKPIPVTVPLAMKIDKEKLQKWAVALEDKIGRPAIDSSRAVTPDGKLTISDSHNGYSVDHREAYKLALKALESTKRATILKVGVIKPERTYASWGKTIVVVRSQRHMRLYDGGKVIFSAPVAVGTPGHPTPLGVWRVVDKVKNPSWSNPHRPWSATMPEYIPPGPSNPLGTRAIYLSADGIRFHGTNNVSSVGTAASHGCMRMYRSNIEALYPLVPIGIDVFILR
jgi:lipoprotein-anchoring transpeptidase ErfK/SrfK